jgi:hypothetical protein
MSGINWARVVLGGFVSGVVINVVEFVLNGVVLSKDWEAAMAALGRPPMSPGQIAVLVAWSFVIWGLFVGIFSVWLYAAIRPRYGAGLKTALSAGFVVWSLGYVLGSAGPAVMNIFPLRLIFIGLAVGLVEVLVAIPLGAWLYKEQPVA